MISIDQTRRALTARFAAAAIKTPELDARLLLGHILGLDLTGLIAQSTRIVSATDAAQLDACAARRLNGEPVARIIGLKEFWSLPLRLSRETLVPRPDTETIVETALSLIDRTQPLKIADLGTGSGAILLALLFECPDAFGIGTDISIDALQTALANARDLGLAGRAGFVACNYASALTGAFDLIVSNPPYIRSAEIASLDRDVRDHDPLRALDGGADGLAAYRIIAYEASRLLKPCGVLVVEVGHDQSVEVQGLIAASGLRQTAPPGRDLAGIPRAISASKP